MVRGFQADLQGSAFRFSQPRSAGTESHSHDGCLLSLREGWSSGEELHVLCHIFCADDSWTEIISVLTSAAIRFEMLSTAHQSQIILDLEDSSISTKGTKSGAFVMYNCARLATLFKTYQQAVEQGAYPAFPPASELNFSLLREEGEWLLLFNYILPFPETLSQAAQLPLSSKGIRITASTEAVRSAGYPPDEGSGQAGLLGTEPQAGARAAPGWRFAGCLWGTGEGCFGARATVLEEVHYTAAVPRGPSQNRGLLSPVEFSLT
uniref:Uncharacterized protein n=1 Tax=Terrapene triunguis TaxID=2587831 RepID=A0A674J123_9SAUR